MTSVATGRRAEAVAARYLVEHGYVIIHRNWQTRYCEIDLVAAKEGKLWFVEVKYRRSQLQGHGLDYITPRKLQRISFAAQLWVERFHWAGDYDLAAIEVSGPEFTITAFTEC